MLTSLFLARRTETLLFAFFLSIHHVIYDPIKHCNPEIFLCSCQVSLFQTQEGLFYVASLCQEGAPFLCASLMPFSEPFFLILLHPFSSGEGGPELLTGCERSANQVFFTIFHYISGKWYFQTVLWTSPNNSYLVNVLRATEP